MQVIFGHRGASGYAPENTLEAFELAAKQGAAGVELDVHRSKDGELGRAKSGVTLIAAQAKAPVVPVFIKYGRKKFRREIQISVGEMIPAEKFDVDIGDKKVLKQVSATIMDEIAKLKENAPDVD